MSIETLNNAARAAGYAMAAVDDSSIEDGPEPRTRPAVDVAGETGLLAEFAPKTSVGEWFKSVFSTFGRGAPA